MKTIGYLVLAAAAATGVLAQAQASTSGGSSMQPFVPPLIPYRRLQSYGWWSRSSTPIEGFAEVWPK